MTILDDRLELLAEVATLYYEDKLTQGEIARRLGISRSNISRLLTEAERQGVIEVRINYPWRTVPELQTELLAHFSLSAARVVQTDRGDYSRILRGVGALAARYLESVLMHTSVKVLAVGWGTTVCQVVDALQIPEHLDIDVVQMIGAVGSRDPLIDGPDLARKLARRLGGRYRFLHAPLIVKSEHVRQALTSQQDISEVLQLARKADITLVGVGATSPTMSGLFLRGGHISEQDLAVIRKMGGVGEICAYHYDAQGQILDIELARRVVGIDIQSLQDMKCVVGVAGGVLKSQAILGALRGGLLDVLVTDDETARDLLRMDETQGARPAQPS